MNFCSACGTRLVEHSHYCGNCGAPVHVLAPQAHPAPVTQRTQLAWFGQFASGDWSGAAKAVGIGIAAMTGMAFIATLLAPAASEPLGFGGLLGRVGTLVALAAGGTFKIAASGFGSGGDLSFRPLGLTFPGFSVMAILFVRRLRRSGTLGGAAVAMQAGRVGSVLLGGLLVVSLLSRSGGGDAGIGAMHVDPFSTMFSGLVTLVIALAVAVAIMLPGMLPPRAERYRALISAPLRAILILILASCAVALVAVVLWTVTVIADFNEIAGIGDFVRSVVASMMLTLPNIAVAALLFGIGVPATSSFTFSFGVDGGSAGSVSILDAVAEDPRFWLWPLIALALFFLAGVLSARRSPIGPSGRPVGYWLGAVAPVMLLILGLNLSTSASGGTVGMMWLAGTAGFDHLFTILLTGIVGLGAGMLGSITARGRVAPAPLAFGPPSADPRA